MATANADDPSSTRDRRRGLRVALAVVVLLVLALIAYANSLQNTALFHHEPNVYADANLDNALLRQPKLFSRIFTDRLMLTTHGEYRPLGYALFALINSVMPRGVFVPWHVLLIGIHAATAVIIYLMLQMLVRPLSALGLAAIYLVLPMFVPLVNDVNMIYVLWGLLFSGATLWLYLVYLRTRNAWFLLLSIIAFGASAFTYSHAVLIPALLIVLCLFQERYHRATVAMLAYVSLGAFFAAMFQVPTWIAVGALYAAVLIAGGAVRAARRQYRLLARTLPPYLVLVGISMLVSSQVPPSPLFTIVLYGLEKAKLIEPFQPWFLYRTMAATSLPFQLSLVVALLSPVLLLLKRPARYAFMAVAAIFLLVATAPANCDYRDDITYWNSLNRRCPGRVPIIINLATAYLDRVEFGTARDLLMHARYRWEVPWNVLDTLNAKLGKAYAGLGNDKVAGYYFLYTPPFGWDQKVMKHYLNDSADFCFRIGYISAAEHLWASALVLDHDDVRLFNNLGRALIYKNFFRAAAKEFRHVLSLEPDNAVALYHLAFAAKALGDEEAYATCRKRWQRLTATDTEMDF